MKQEQLKQKVRSNAVIFKIIFILVMILLLMIPNMLIRDLISERNNRKTQIEAEVAKSYGGLQKIVAPILKIPYKITTRYDSGSVSTKTGEVNYTPENTDIKGSVITGTRKRSIYEVVVYDSEIEMNSSIKSEILDENYHSEKILDYSKAYLVFGLSDPNGLSDASTISVNDKEIALDGLSTINVGTVKWVKTRPFEVEPGMVQDIKAKLSFKGTRALMFEPIGDKITVALSSPWKDPSFTGTKLPSSYDITDEGFVSNWTVAKYAHNYPKVWIDSNTTLNQNFGFGVNLIQPIDEYGKNSRTAKYALLIIVLTFAIFFFFEILFKKQIHPIQYALVGFALTIFFLLLLSISEHMGFDVAYLISSIATIALIVSYSKYMLSSKKASVILMLLLAGLFAYIFIILQMQDFALLAGALALFTVLATIMFLSRKVNWYQLGTEENKEVVSEEATAK